MRLRLPVQGIKGGLNTCAEVPTRFSICLHTPSMEQGKACHTRYGTQQGMFQAMQQCYVCYAIAVQSESCCKGQSTCTSGVRESTWGSQTHLKSPVFHCEKGGSSGVASQEARRRRCMYQNRKFDCTKQRRQARHTCAALQADKLKHMNFSGG